MSSQQLLELEKQVLLQVYKRPPFVLERGEGAYLYDTDGRRYLDMAGGIAVNALGHGDAGMQRAIAEAATKLLHVSNLYHTEPAIRLAQKLVESCFADRVFFTNSGTEAVEGALKLARKAARFHSGNPDKLEILAFAHAFHGRTMGALSATANPKYREPFGPLLPNVRFAPFNDPASAAHIGPHTAAVIVEPVQGEGGIVAASDDFLAALRDACNDHGAFLIFDEIQCGLGRTGTLWAHQATGVEPDLLVVAKPLGGGLPIGAILLRERVAQAIGVGEHGSTFAGGPFITAVAGYVWERLSDPAMLDHVREVGGLLGEQLSELAAELPLVRAVRGRGLMWGVELDEARPVADVVAAAPEHGLLLVGAGRNTLRLVPPLIIEPAHVDELRARLRTLLAH